MIHPIANYSRSKVLPSRDTTRTGSYAGKHCRLPVSRSKAFCDPVHGIYWPSTVFSQWQHAPAGSRTHLLRPNVPSWLQPQLFRHVNGTVCPLHQVLRSETSRFPTKHQESFRLVELNGTFNCEAIEEWLINNSKSSYPEPLEKRKTKSLIAKSEDSNSTLDFVSRSQQDNSEIPLITKAHASVLAGRANDVGKRSVETEVKKQFSMEQQKKLSNVDNHKLLHLYCINTVEEDKREQNSNVNEHCNASIKSDKLNDKSTVIFGTIARDGNEDNSSFVNKNGEDRDKQLLVGVHDQNVVNFKNDEEKVHEEQNLTPVHEQTDISLDFKRLTQPNWIDGYSHDADNSQNIEGMVDIVINEFDLKEPSNISFEDSKEKASDDRKLTDTQEHVAVITEYVEGKTKEKPTDISISHNSFGENVCDIEDKKEVDTQEFVDIDVASIKEKISEPEEVTIKYNLTSSEDYTEMTFSNRNSFVEQEIEDYKHNTANSVSSNSLVISSAYFNTKENYSSHSKNGHYDYFSQKCSTATNYVLLHENEESSVVNMQNLKLDDFALTDTDCSFNCKVERHNCTVGKVSQKSSLDYSLITDTSINTIPSCKRGFKEKKLRKTTSFTILSSPTMQLQLKPETCAEIIEALNMSVKFHPDSFSDSSKGSLRSSFKCSSNRKSEEGTYNKHKNSSLIHENISKGHSEDTKAFDDSKDPNRSGLAGKHISRLNISTINSKSKQILTTSSYDTQERCRINEAEEKNINMKNMIRRETLFENTSISDTNSESRNQDISLLKLEIKKTHTNLDSIQSCKGDCISSNPGQNTQEVKQASAKFSKSSFKPQKCTGNTNDIDVQLSSDEDFVESKHESSMSLYTKWGQVLQASCEGLVEELKHHLSDKEATCIQRCLSGLKQRCAFTPPFLFPFSYNPALRSIFPLIISSLEAVTTAAYNMATLYDILQGGYFPNIDAEARLARKKNCHNITLQLFDVMSNTSKYCGELAKSLNLGRASCLVSPCDPQLEKLIRQNLPEGIKTARNQHVLATVGSSPFLGKTCSINRSDLSALRNPWLQNSDMEQRGKFPSGAQWYKPRKKSSKQEVKPNFQNADQNKIAPDIPLNIPKKKMTQKVVQSYDEKLSSHLPSREIFTHTEDCLRILNTLYNMKESEFLRHPVSETFYLDYYKVAKHPMCMDLIAYKLRQRIYKKLEEFMEDFRHIFSSVYLYNAASVFCLKIIRIYV
ncbi:uncharacterized protein LOC143228357 [Tachypleus tridentatus]|uniref:uncharacterized protein LOC143228357 n=1 Tax=Tachypleus tridentatus TaxID=6853 RepID=UPI003FD632D3